MKQTLDHNKEANKKQNIVENIEAQIDLNEILESCFVRTQSNVEGITALVSGQKNI